MMERRWVFAEPADRKTVEHLQERLGVEQKIAELLAQRKINSFDEAKAFFRPQLSDLHDPFLMKNMQVAIERLEQALGEGEKVLVFGDYDVDGTTAVAMVYSFLKEHYDQVGFYIPDRYKEGYGISKAGIDYAKENNYGLIIALDCGIRAVDQVAYANTLGIDFIICDHHIPGPSLPEAAAILNPKQKDCDYPFKELSGCGVGFKFIQGFCKKNNYDEAQYLQYLDLLAISIACDIVPIVGENRILAAHGLKHIKSTPRVAFTALLPDLTKKQELTISDLVFGVGPRINAAGRIEHGKMAVSLMVTDAVEEAQKIAEQINLNNDFRKDVDKKITKEALAMIAEDPSARASKSTVLFNEHWHKGVIGIVASRIIETHYKPTIVLTLSNGKATGSARSVKGFDVFNALTACAEHLEQFGGHKYAAGLTLEPDHIPAFRKRFEQVASAQISSKMAIPEIEISTAMDFEHITPKFLRILDQFAPFGPGNMKPVFSTKGVEVVGKTRRVGESHLKMVLLQNKNGKRFSAIGFGFGEYAEKIQAGEPFDIAYTVEENDWMGNKELQLNLKDIKLG